MSSQAQALHEQFVDLEQQHDASWTGMWIFLVTEVMFFSALFAAYATYRNLYPAAFAEGSRHLEAWLGAINTAVLICSSLTMALAVHSAKVGSRGLVVGFLLCTMVIGAVFLGVKFFEYYQHYGRHEVPGPGFAAQVADPRRSQIFFSLYFLMTGLHAIHMLIGEGALFTLVIQSLRGKYSPQHHAPVELVGLYWHFVDMVWIFLFPLLYLVG